MATYNNRGHKFKSIGDHSGSTTVTIAADEYALIWIKSMQNDGSNSVGGYAGNYWAINGGIAEFCLGKGTDVVSVVNTGTNHFTVAICDGSHLA